MGSHGSHLVRMVSPNPTNTAALVQQSVSTCLPFASRVSDFFYRPSQTRYPPKAPLMSVAAAVRSEP